MPSRSFLSPKLLILVLLVLAAVYMAVFFGGFEETREAQTVDRIQVKLQEAVSQGVVTFQVTPSALAPANVVNAIHTDLPKGLHLDTRLHLAFLKSRREAQYEIREDGAVMVQALTNFHRYHIEHGRITRNNRWLPAP